MAQPMLAITFRALATDGDAQACAALMAESPPWTTLGYDYPTLLRTVANPARECYLADVGARLSGFILLNLQGPFSGYVQSICVAPQFRSQGCGSQLIAFAEDRILRDHPNVFLCVSAFNHGARAFYARRGYACIGEIENYVVAGQSEFLLRKTRGPMFGV